jgi:hypothetical protein
LNFCALVEDELVTDGIFDDFLNFSEDFWGVSGVSTWVKTILTSKWMTFKLSREIQFKITQNVITVMNVHILQSLQMPLVYKTFEF